MICFVGSRQVKSWTSKAMSKFAGTYLDSWSGMEMTVYIGGDGGGNGGGATHTW